MRWLGVIFAALTAVAAFGIGCMVQANSISAMLAEAYRVPAWLSGAVMTVLTAVVILGGIQSIAAWASSSPARSPDRPRWAGSWAPA